MLCVSCLGVAAVLTLWTTVHVSKFSLRHKIHCRQLADVDVNKYAPAMKCSGTQGGWILRIRNLWACLCVLSLCTTVVTDGNKVLTCDNLICCIPNLHHGMYSISMSWMQPRSHLSAKRHGIGV